MHAADDMCGACDEGVGGVTDEEWTDGRRPRGLLPTRGTPSVGGGPRTRETVGVIGVAARYPFSFPIEPSSTVRLSDCRLRYCTSPGSHFTRGVK